MRKTGGRGKGEGGRGKGRAGGGRREAGRRERRSGVARAPGGARPGAAREKNRVLKSQQDLLAGGEIQQRHADRLLPRRRDVAAAVSRESAGGADAVSRRDRRKVFLPEGRARLRS